ncbi:MAG: hypothetical protein A3K19_19795 [Lentisphaerae bacterium RIFOXYB12_FULL_65_16]|nr:MAG: hypothetical protein A3K18_07555 [Lentisphaerae bacterium RIFOXYA12_64_32]OGV85051.1 MAG: hypothetical protein A3K19_19795 [Lentisphaerae bacterium RIFOXYB12_FULL_65_16]
MQNDASITIKTRAGATLTARRLALADGKALQVFNAGLSIPSERYFRAHAYDDATVRKVLERAEAGEDLTLGVFDGPLLVGYFFLWYFTEPVPLLGIGLLDAYHGTGVARQMMDILIAEAKSAGKDGIELTTMQDNPRAYTLYEKCGFRYHGDVENLQGDGSIVIERAMFYPIKPGAQPPQGAHAPPVR